MKNRWNSTKLNRLISVLLIFSLLIAQWPASAFAWEGEEYQDDVYTDELFPDAYFENEADSESAYDDSFFDDEADGVDWIDPYDTWGWEEENDDKLYESDSFRYGYILIWNYEQLIHVGSGLPVTSLDQEESCFGLGESVWADEETPLTYASDADYMLACDIPFPDGWAWTLPEDFTGSFTSWKSLEDPSWSIAEESPLLYDAEYDTVFLYHAAQLDALLAEAGAERAVRVQDYDLYCFGTGETVCPEEADSVTYSPDRHYVLSALFSYDLSEEDLRAFYKTEKPEPEEELPDWDEEETAAQEDLDEFTGEDDSTSEKTESVDPEEQMGPEQDSTESAEPSEMSELNQEPDENAASETKEDTAPETEESADPETKEETAPKAEESADPEAKEDTAPETEESTDPEAKEDTDPESAESTDPETKEDTDPESAESTDPETKEDTDPEIAESTESDKKEDIVSETAEKADPEKKIKTAQEPAEKTESNTEEKSAQTVKPLPTTSLRQDESAMTPAAKAWQCGYIYIYHFAQLQAVGTDKAITTLDHEAETFGLGGEVWADEETKAVYAKDGCYVLANDIPFPDGETWVLPEGFTGKFIPLEQANAAVAEAAERARAERAKTATVEYSAEPEYAQEISNEQEAYTDPEKAADVPQEIDQADEVTAETAVSDAETDAAEADAEPDGNAWVLEAVTDTASFDAPFAEPEGEFAGNEADGGFAENESGDMELPADFETDENIEIPEEPGDYEYENETGEDQNSELNNTGEAEGNEDASDLPEEELPDFEAELLPDEEESGDEEETAAQEAEPEELFQQITEGDSEDDEESDVSAAPSEDSAVSRDAQDIEDEKTPLLYDAEADTIYLYHPGQLTALHGDDRSEQPVMSLDYDAARFGTGKLIPVSADDRAEDENMADTETVEGEDEIGGEHDAETGKPYLTYSAAHHYVLSASFSAEHPEPAEKLCEAASYRSGYIFIHHFDQLFEIASGHVITAEDHLEGELGRGDAVWADQNTLAFYAPDANYVLMSDIPFPDGETWVLPENFAGRFVLRAEAEKQLSASEAAAVENGEEPALETGEAAVGETDKEPFADAALQAADEQAFSAPAIMEEFPEEEIEETPEASLEEIPLILSDDASFEAAEGEAEDTASGEEASTPKLYDKDTDTLYLYHPYQLKVLRTEDREEQPVMSMDYDMASFGMGKFIIPDGEEDDEAEKDGEEDEHAASGEDGAESLMLEDSAVFMTENQTEEGEQNPEGEAPVGKEKQFLTYGKAHHYVLSASFSAAMPARKMLRAPLRGANSNNDLIDGRDYFGQVTVDIGGTTYILIGDRQQLDAINDDSSLGRTKVYGPVFKVYQQRQSLGNWNPENVTSTVTMIYPGDADLIKGVFDGSEQKDFSENVMYSGNNGILASDPYHSLTNVLDITGYDRTFYCTIDPATGTWSVDARSDPTLTYEKDGNYIVFRDIDMTLGALDPDDIYDTDTNWKPLMFTGTMYGVKAENRTDVGTLWDSGKTVMNIDPAYKPEIQNLTVVPETLSQLGDIRLDLNVQTGVGFFGTLTGQMNATNFIGSQVVVKNLRILNGSIYNPTVKADIDLSLINGVLVAVATALGVLLDPILKGLTHKDIGVQQMLTGLLNARAKDPGSVATGGFAGRIIGNALVEECEVKNVAVTTVLTGYENDHHIVGKGGFVGTVEGVTRYDFLTNALGAVGDGLAGLLNLIPGLGLGDIVTVLLSNALPVDELIPTGYTQPIIKNCIVNNCTLSTEGGKIGVGGFVGSLCGTEIYDSKVINSTMTVNADYFGGGFAGIERDAIIKGTLSGLGVDIGSLHPQSELIRCSITNSTMTVSGGSYLGGFVGAMANSYGINDTVSGGSMNVTGAGDFVGGFCGYAHLGTLFGFGSFLEEGDTLLSTVKGLVTGLLGSGSDQSLLDVGGVAPSAIMGVQIDTPLTVSSEGAFVGGLVGRGNGTYITPSSENYLRKLGKYDGNNPPALPIGIVARQNTVSNLVSVTAGAGVTDNTYNDKSFAGGLAGYLTSASVGGLLGDTAGVAQYLGFTVCGTTITGVDAGYTVTAAEDYGAGGIAWAVGGDVYDTELLKLASVTARNHAGGFVGATGPGDLVSGNGLDLQLLGISLIKIDNLLSLASGVRTTYERANVTGIETGYTVLETGDRITNQSEYAAGGWGAQANSVRVVDCHAKNLRSVIANMNDGYGGGFIGSSSAGGLAGVVEDSANLTAAQVGQLVNAVPYLVPSYDGCYVAYVDGGFVQADTAGGFAGDFRSGKVNTYSADDINPIRDDTDPDYQYSLGTDLNGKQTKYEVGIESEAWSVYNIDHVRGGKYGGGWGGNVYSGALISAGGGLSVLGGAASAALSATQLLGVASVYVPTIKYAGVYADGFTVFAAHDYNAPGGIPESGYAGGFIGYGSGVQVSYSDVCRLRHGEPSTPAALTHGDNIAYSRFGIYPDELESQDGSSYMRFSNDPSVIPYAVAGACFAGGYIGHMDIGSAASVGDGLKLLGNSLSLTNVLDALSVVVSTIEHSDVIGAPGGFNVIASPHISLCDGGYGNSGGLGVSYAGGFAGKISGGHIQDSNVMLFYYIVGEIAAGGYVGEMIPGAVASVLKDGSSLSLLGQVNDLASLVQDFVPTIRNSETNCVPCGGAVRAQCPSDGSEGGNEIRGMAGGYVGHCKGGQIWGNNTDRWKDENPYNGVTRPCDALRIRSVYGREYSGGYCGLMECGSTAQTGGLKLLGGLISADNLLGALDAVYPTIYEANVYGPLWEIDFDTWDKWNKFVGSQGSFYAELYQRGNFVDQADLDANIGQFQYGMHVVAGRHELDNSANTILSGCAGGFVGSMHSGVIRYTSAQDVKLVSAMRAAGGYAGEMQTKGVAEFGTTQILGLNLDIGNLVKLANVFVPCISDSGTEGYDLGLTVQATGDRNTNGVGCAGGYVGGCYGGQLSREESGTAEKVWIHRLKAVYGTYCIGGFAGKCGAASVLDANTNDASSGLLQNILNSLVSTPANLLSLLQATMSTVKYAEVTASDPIWGIVVDGTYSGGIADYAGGFAGYLEAAVLGERRNASDTLQVSDLREVRGGQYAGGFFGLADVTAVADVSSGGGTSILNLVNLGNTSLLDAFRTYIYHAGVTSVPDGLRVTASGWTSRGTMNQYQVSGGAGGFGGGLMNGTVEHSWVTGLNTIAGPNYAAGFVAQMGKSGVLDLKQLQVGNDSLLGRVIAFLGIDPNVGAQLLSIVGSTVKNCAAEGFGPGFIVSTDAVQSSALNGSENEAFLTGSCAGGFTGFADTAQIDNCEVSKVKYITSPQVAGGFIGRGSMAYVAEVDVDLTLVNALLTLLSPVIQVLYGLTTIDLINIPGGDVLGLKLLADGNVVYLNLLGLEISVSLMRNDPEYEGSSDSLTIVLGSSTIKLPYNPSDGYNSSAPNASINLIEGNRTSVKNSTVTGISSGYDVFGGGASQGNDGSGSFGYAGGFVGYNKMGYFSHDRMWLCDVVRGTSGLVGPFVGGMLPGTRGQEYLEGNDNWYSFYRTANAALTEVKTSGGTGFGTMTQDAATGMNRYDTQHFSVIKTHANLINAVQSGAAATAELKAWESAAKAVLMLDTPQSINPKSEAIKPDEKKDPCDEDFTLTVHKKWRDYNDMFATRPTELEVEVEIIDVGTKPRAQLVQSIFPESDWTRVDITVLKAQYPDAPLGDKNPIILKLKSDSGDEDFHWKNKLEKLPVAYRATVMVDDGTGTNTLVPKPKLDTNGDPVLDEHGKPVYETEIHYLQYVVTERVPDGYKLVQYELLEDTASVVILNEIDSVVLPATGGPGEPYYMLAGIPLTLGIILLEIKKRRRIIQNE